MIIHEKEYAIVNVETAYFLKWVRYGLGLSPTKWVQDLLDFYFANRFLNGHHFLYLQLFSTLFQI